MKYISTRGSEEIVTATQAISNGLAGDGGLYVPQTIPRLSPEQIAAMSSQSYAERAFNILSLFLTDYDQAQLRSALEMIYRSDEEINRFDPAPAPLVQLNPYNEREYILELWHGPSAAFKDLALQLLPFLLTSANQKNDKQMRPCILTATSGDTGKAMLEGFRDVPDTEAIVFYPVDGVSEMQKMQMVTQEGDNCHVVAIEGTFDDAQTAVKQLFLDQNLRDCLAPQNYYLTSANSINWGRLVPQIVYYFSAYADLIARDLLAEGEKVNFVVPTGNFGNILAAWYASQMGLPVNKLICASNRNKVLSDFIRTGRYDRRRTFYQTNAPSMDILISSNLERLLFELTDRSQEQLNSWMTDLNEKGFYQVDQAVLRRIQEKFVGGFADDQGAIKTIREVYDRTDHVIDTHTAVGFNVYERYQKRSSDETKTIFVATACPFKFPEAVGDALFGRGYAAGRSLEKLLAEISQEGGMQLPPSLEGLTAKTIRHDKVVQTGQLADIVLGILSDSTD